MLNVAGSFNMALHAFHDRVHFVSLPHLPGSLYLANLKQYENFAVLDFDLAQILSSTTEAIVGSVTWCGWWFVQQRQQKLAE